MAPRRYVDRPRDEVTGRRRTHAISPNRAGTAATLFAAALHLSAAAVEQTQDCSADGQSARRREAIQLARRINTAQSGAFSSQKAYQPLDALPGVTVPPGFAVQLVTNASSYIFTVKGGCGFGLFSDQNGVIYVGETLK